MNIDAVIYETVSLNNILKMLSYQFFGKVNDPDTAKYYERFFEIIKKETTSISRGHNLNFDSRITTGEREVAKRRADVFFRLKQGEFITYADGKDKKIKFHSPEISRERPRSTNQYSQKDIDTNFERVYHEARSIFN